MRSRRNPNALAARLRAIEPNGPAVAIAELCADPSKASERLRVMCNRMNSLCSMVRRSEGLPESVKLSMVSNANWSITHNAMVLTVSVFAISSAGEHDADDSEVSFD